MFNLFKKKSSVWVTLLWCQFLSNFSMNQTPDITCSSPKIIKKKVDVKVCETNLDPKNPLKLKITSRKRKTSDSEPIVPEKKSKMEKKDFDEIMQKFSIQMKTDLTDMMDKKFDDQQTKLDVKFDSVNEKIVAAVNEKIEGMGVKQHMQDMTKELSDLKEVVNQVQVDKTVSENRLDAMEMDMKELRDQLSNGLCKKDIDQVKSQLLPAWKASLAKEVWDHEH